MASSLISQAKELTKHLSEGQTSALPPEFNLDRVIGYEPRHAQKWLTENERRFNVEVIHRRFGKTFMKVRKLMHHAVYCPFEHGRYAYLAPTYSQAEDIAWMYLQEWAQRVLRKLGLPENEWINRSKLAVFLPTFNGTVSRIRLYGVDSPKQRIRGLYLDGVVLDEYAWIPPSVWAEQVRPMLMDENRSGTDFFKRRNQWADFIFTPMGRNHAYTLYRQAKQWHDGEPVVQKDVETGVDHQVFSDEWFAARLPASETGVLSRVELNSAANQMGRSKYDQEMEVSFDAALEGAIYARDVEWLKQQNQITTLPYNPLLPVLTGWDLGYDDATAIWFCQIQGEQIRVIDYYEAYGAPLSHYADVLAQKDYRYGQHYLPWDVEVTELGTGKSRSAILRELGIRPTTVTKHAVVDRISAVQAALPRCLFDRVKCADGIDKLSLYRREYDERRGVMREAPLHDWTSHAADAFGYLVMGARSRLSKAPPGGYQVAEM